ncbi:MAG: hypothetical protein IKM61_03770 [Eubacteriaceae bacterium]|nr:hypothetical protein [Eubacteriaceae bacterium]
MVTINGSKDIVVYGKRNINFGIYTTKSSSSIIEGKMLLQGIHEYAYETNLDIPNEELDLILHLKLLTFENSGRDMRFPICGPHERYYFTIRLCTAYFSDTLF